MFVDTIQRRGTANAQNLRGTKEKMVSVLCVDWSRNASTSVLNLMSGTPVMSRGPVFLNPTFSDEGKGMPYFAFRETSIIQ